MISLIVLLPAAIATIVISINLCSKDVDLSLFVCVFVLLEILIEEDDW